jgi:hypothetical protein
MLLANEIDNFLHQLDMVPIGSLARGSATYDQEIFNQKLLAKLENDLKPVFVRCLLEIPVGREPLAETEHCTTLFSLLNQDICADSCRRHTFSITLPLSW